MQIILPSVDPEGASWSLKGSRVLGGRGGWETPHGRALREEWDLQGAVGTAWLKGYGQSRWGVQELSVLWQQE